MSWLGRALGNFGSQVGEGSQIAEQLRQRKAQFDADQAMQKMQQSMMPFQIQEIQQRIASQKQQQSLAPWQSFETRNTDGSIEQGLYNIITGERKIISKSTGQPKYSGYHVNDKGQLVANNSLTSMEEIVPGTEGMSFPIPGQRQNTPQERPETQIFGGYRWQYDPENKVQGPRQGPWVRLGIAKEPGEPKQEQVGPKERNIELNNTLMSLRAQLTQAAQDAREVMGAHLKHGQGLWSRMTTGDPDPSAAQARVANIQKAIAFIESHRQGIVTGSEDMGQIVNQALAIMQGENVGAPTNPTNPSNPGGKVKSFTPGK